jgi:hypothetical protein
MDRETYPKMGQMIQDCGALYPQPRSIGFVGDHLGNHSN